MGGGIPRRLLTKFSYVANILTRRVSHNAREISRCALQYVTLFEGSIKTISVKEGNIRGVEMCIRLKITLSMEVVKQIPFRAAENACRFASMHSPTVKVGNKESLASTTRVSNYRHC
jgi:hypothetical protein